MSTTALRATIATLRRQAGVTADTAEYHKIMRAIDALEAIATPAPTKFMTTCSACGDDLDTCNDPGAHRRGTCTFCDDPSATLCEACSDDLQRHPVRVRTPRRTDDLDGWTGWGK